MNKLSGYDIFISHAHADLHSANLLTRSLNDRGFVSWVADWEVALNDSWQEKMTEALENSAVCLFLFGPSKNVPWCHEAVWSAIDNRVRRSHGEFRLISVVLPGASLDMMKPLQTPSGEALMPFALRDAVQFETSCDDDKKLNELVLLIRGAYRKPSAFLQHPEWRQMASMIAGEFSSHVNTPATKPAPCGNEMASQVTTKSEDIVQLAKAIGATVEKEDEAIAYGLARAEDEMRSTAFARLHAKYYQIICDYLARRYSDISATGRSMIADTTFDRVWDFSKGRSIRAANGSLSGFLKLICEWESRKILRAEKRRYALLAEHSQDLWSVQGNESTASREMISCQNSPLRFVDSFLREPLTVGSLWPSSSILARAVVNSCEFCPGDTVVELGPGTGAFTEMLLDRLDGRGRLIAVELNQTNIEVLRRRFPPCRVIHDSAENLPRHLGRQRADCIISSLAWGNMMPRVQDRILEAVWKSLSSHGQFVAFAYAHAFWLPTALRFRRLLFQNFARVETTPIVWRNLPPAYIYRCWLKPAKPTAEDKKNIDFNRHRRRSRQRV